MWDRRPVDVCILPSPHSQTWPSSHLEYSSDVQPPTKPSLYMFNISHTSTLFRNRTNCHKHIKLMLNVMSLSPNVYLQNCYTHFNKLWYGQITVNWEVLHVVHYWIKISHIVHTWFSIITKSLKNRLSIKKYMPHNMKLQGSQDYIYNIFDTIHILHILSAMNIRGSVLVPHIFSLSNRW